MYGAFFKQSIYLKVSSFYKIGTFKLEIKTASPNAWNSNANEKLKNMAYPSI